MAGPRAPDMSAFVNAGANLGNARVRANALEQERRQANIRNIMSGFGMLDQAVRGTRAEERADKADARADRASDRADKSLELDERRVAIAEADLHQRMGINPKLWQRVIDGDKDAMIEAEQQHRRAADLLFSNRGYSALKEIETKYDLQTEADKAHRAYLDTALPLVMEDIKTVYPDMPEQERKMLALHKLQPIFIEGAAKMRQMRRQDILGDIGVAQAQRQEETASHLHGLESSLREQALLNAQNRQTAEGARWEALAEDAENIKDTVRNMTGVELQNSLTALDAAKIQNRRTKNTLDKLGDILKIENDGLTMKMATSNITMALMSRPEVYVKYADRLFSQLTTDPNELQAAQLWFNGETQKAAAMRNVKLNEIRETMAKLESMQEDYDIAEKQVRSEDEEVARRALDPRRGAMSQLRDRLSKLQRDLDNMVIPSASDAIAAVRSMGYTRQGEPGVMDIFRQEPTLDPTTGTEYASGRQAELARGAKKNVSKSPNSVKVPSISEEIGADLDAGG